MPKSRYPNGASAFFFVGWDKIAGDAVVLLQDITATEKLTVSGTAIPIWAATPDRRIIPK